MVDITAGTLRFNRAFPMTQRPACTLPPDGPIIRPTVGAAFDTQLPWAGPNKFPIAFTQAPEGSGVCFLECSRKDL
eukprot:3506853-Pyramimonas_sp.AAC.1